jgi:hypothetical protein
MTGFRRARGLAPVLATALVALLALVGPATAHNGKGWHDDDDPAGTIASYDGETRKLVIDLAKGGSISGVVTSRTWINDGDRGCNDGSDGDASRKAKQARKGGKQARTGDWCHERRNGDHGDHGDRGWHHGWDKGDESDLVAGAVVEDAILILKDGKAFYAKVELD